MNPKSLFHSRAAHATRYPIIKNPKTALVAFAKDPSRVEVKTRLSTKLAPEERRLIYSSLLTGCLYKLCTITGGAVYLACYPDKNSSFFENITKGSDIKLIDQVGDDLGSKMENCFRKLLRVHEQVVIFGTDIPDLPTNEIESSFKQSSDWDILIGPTYDGGYYAIGLNINEFKPIFTDVAWSTETVLAKTKENCDKLELRVNYLPKVRDIDTFEDLLSLNSKLKKVNTAVHNELKEALLEINFSSKQNTNESKK